MRNELCSVVDFCNKSTVKDIKKYLKQRIIEATVILDKLHIAHGESPSNSKYFEFDGKRLTYSNIAEYILFINALKSLLIELVIFGKKRDYADILYDLVATYEIELAKYTVETRIVSVDKKFF